MLLGVEMLKNGANIKAKTNRYKTFLRTFVVILFLLKFKILWGFCQETLVYIEKNWCKLRLVKHWTHLFLRIIYLTEGITLRLNGAFGRGVFNSFGIDKGNDPCAVGVSGFAGIVTLFKNTSRAA